MRIVKLMYYFLMLIVCYYLFFNSFFACQSFHWLPGTTIACHCNLFLVFNSFGSGNVAPASLSNNNINKGRWTQNKHNIFMEEYEKYDNNRIQIAKVLSTRAPNQIKKAC